MKSANASKASLLYEVRSELECPICREFFTEPKQLLCGHTFCNNCLIRVSTENSEHFPWSGLSNFEMNPSTFQCPQCRQSHRGRIQDIGTNYILKDMVEKLKDAQDSEEEPEPCSKCAKLTSSTELFLCNSCPSNSAQPQPKYCSLCTIQQHNGHSLKPYQEIVMQKGLDDIQVKADLLHQSFQIKKKKIETTIEIASQALNSMKEEINEMTVPIHELFVSRPIIDNLQYYTMEVKNNLEKEFTRNQMMIARMEKYSTELKVFLEKFMNFDDYAKKFLRLDSQQFDNFELEQLTFGEMRQQEEHSFRFGEHPHPYLYFTTRRGRRVPLDRRPPGRHFSPNPIDLDSDSDYEQEIAPMGVNEMAADNPRANPSASAITGLNNPTGTPFPLFEMNNQRPNLIPSEGNNAVIGAENRGPLVGGFGSRPMGYLGNRYRRIFSPNADNNGGSGSRFRNGNNASSGCNKCHTPMGTSCRCNAGHAQRGGGRGGNNNANFNFFPRPNITNSSHNNSTNGGAFPSPSIGSSGSRVRGSGVFGGYHRGRGGSHSSHAADNSSRASITAQNGSVIGSNQGSDMNTSEMASTSNTTANRIGGRGGRSFGRGGRSRPAGGNDTCSDLSMESIRD